MTRTESAIPRLFEEKALLTRKEGVLQFVPQAVRMNDVGGLQNLKDWLKNDASVRAIGERAEILFGEPEGKRRRRKVPGHAGEPLLSGQIFAAFVIVIAAAEAAVALAIFLNFYNNFSTIDVERAQDLKG